MSSYDPTALVKTCKQMREEYLELFFASNKFAVHVAARGLLENIGSLVKAIGGKNLRKIPVLIFDVHVGTFNNSDKACEEHLDALYTHPIDGILITFVDCLRDDAKELGALLRSTQYALLRARFTVVGDQLERRDHSMWIQFQWDSDNLSSSTPYSRNERYLPLFPARPAPSSPI